MAGLIRKEDIDEVRARTDIREIIEGYVSLKSAGIGTFKGLCPFHDERTPSFNVRPPVSYTHLDVYKRQGRARTVNRTLR